MLAYKQITAESQKINQNINKPNKEFNKITYIFITAITMVLMGFIYAKLLL